jgi:hypothetical protein
MDAGLIQIDRGFSVAGTSERRYIKVNKAAQTIDVDFPFELRESYDGLSLVCEVEFTQTVATGEALSGRRAFYSPAFEVAGYNETLANDILEPILKPTAIPPSSNGLSLLTLPDFEATSVIPKEAGSQVIVSGVFENDSSNFTEFNQAPAIPFQYQPNDFTDQYLCGYIGITDGTGKYYQFSNLRDNDPTNIIEGPVSVDYASASTNNFFGGPQFQISAQLNVDALVDFFGDFECLFISARIDKIQYPSPIGGGAFDLGEFSLSEFDV